MPLITKKVSPGLTRDEALKAAYIEGTFVGKFSYDEKTGDVQMLIDELPPEAKRPPPDPNAPDVEKLYANAIAAVDALRAAIK